MTVWTSSTSPTSPNYCCYTTLWKSKHQNVILRRDIAKENCIRCIIRSSKLTRIIMCLTFTYLGCYTAKPVWNNDSWHRRLAKTLNANLFWLWLEHHHCWHQHLRSCVHAGDGHFERMLWPECSFIWFIRTFYATVNVIWCMQNAVILPLTLF